MLSELVAGGPKCCLSAGLRWERILEAHAWFPLGFTLHTSSLCRLCSVSFHCSNSWLGI